MAKSEDLLKSIRQRLANPFIFSFLLSWLVYNWRIPVGLLWYNSHDIAAVGYSSMFALIKAQIEDLDNTYTPLYVSVAITFGIPVLRIIFSSFDAAITRAGNWLYFNISKDSYISTTKFLNLKEDYSKSIVTLEKVIKEEKEFEAKYRESLPRLEQLDQQSEVLKKLFDQEFLNGTWEFRYTQRKTVLTMRFISTNVQITEPTPDGGSKVYPNDNLSFFMRDIRGTERLVFQVRRIDEKSSMTLRFFYLTISGVNRYEGFENFQDQVTITRIS